MAEHAPAADIAPPDGRTARDVPPLSLRIKFAYASGRIAEAVNIRAFETFLFFYYVQVLELSGGLSGLAVGIALCFDAVTDPVLGSLSDNFRSRWGRRHPFMLAAAVPLPIAFVLLFMPPPGLGQLGLFAWLTLFAVATRAAMTLFHVPHLSLGAELSTDYFERTKIVAMRSFAGILGSATTAVLGFSYYFRATDTFPNGQMNAEAYPGFAVVCAAAMAMSILVCVWGTRREIPRLPPAPDTADRFGPVRVFTETRAALRNPSFRFVFISLILIAVSSGVHATLMLHLATYYWALSPGQLNYAILGLTGGALLGVPLAGRLHLWLDKKPSWILTVILAVGFSTGPVALRLVGWFPGNDSPALIPLLVVSWVLSMMGSLAAGITVGSMMADIADEHELFAGKRQEGIFFGALSLSGKAASALGHIVAGVGLQLIAWPQGTDIRPEDVDPATVWKLGVLYAPVTWIFAVGALFMFARYRLNRTRHAEIRAALDARANSGRA